jgi:chromosome segregation ATPase
MDITLNTLRQKLKKKETELKTVSDILVHHKQELVKTKSELESLNRELIQTNQAMSVLAKKIDIQKAELEDRVNTTIATKIMPIIKDIQTEPKIKKFWPEINLMAEHLNSMVTKNKLSSYLLSVLGND